MNERVQLLPGVCLRVVNADKFKTACFSINFLQPLTRQIAPLNALLPSVLLRGTRRHPGIREILQRHRDAGGKIAVVSHSMRENIERDYRENGLPVPDLIFGWEQPPEQRKP